MQKPVEHVVEQNPKYKKTFKCKHIMGVAYCARSMLKPPSSQECSHRTKAEAGQTQESRQGAPHRIICLN